MGSERAVHELDDVIERYHLALGAFMRGDHEPARRLYSEGDDVTLGNPFGPYGSKASFSHAFKAGFREPPSALRKREDASAVLDR